MKVSIVQKISLLSALLVALTAGVVASVFYNNTTEVLTQQVLFDLSREVLEQGSRMKSRIESHRKDVLILASTPHVQGILRAQRGDGIDALEKSSYKQWIDGFNNIFHAFMKVNPDYQQVRFINELGQELIRMERRGNKIVSIEENQLQNKNSRRYFKETIKLSSGAVYLSEINLNREHGKIVKPYQGSLRAATPVFDNDTNELGGMVVLNLDIDVSLKRIQQNVKSPGRKIYITNDHGGYLLHPDPDRAYSFDLGQRHRAQEDIPQLSKLYLPGNTDTQLILLPEQTKSRDTVVYTKTKFDPASPERFITVGLTQSYAVIVAEANAALGATLVWVFVLIGIGVLMSIVFSIRMTQPLKKMIAAIDDIADKPYSDVQAGLPMDQQDEIGLLARTFDTMFFKVKQSQDELKNINEYLESKIEERTRDLKISESRQRAVLETMVDGVLVINTYGIIRSFNKAAEKMFGFAAEEVIDKNIKMLMPEPDHSGHDQYLENYKQTGHAQIIGIGREVVARRKDGAEFPMDLAVTETMIDNEVMYTGLVRDITERKEMENIKNEFISTVSHELRTPLTSIRGSLGLLTGGAVGELPEQAKNMLNIASNNTERLLLLINDILDIEKIESGQIAFKFKPVDIMPLIKTALLENEAYGRQHEIEFKLVNVLDEARVYVDPDRLMQVMNNLLSNAAKFSPQGDVVEISISRHHDDILRVSVSDHGDGIPESFHAKLFEKFTQSDSSDTRQKGGTGLGLSISKAIIEKHGGQIGFLSREGIGTTMYFELPEVVGKLVDDIAQPRRVSGGHRACILILEDDPDVAALMQRMLAEAGFNSDIAYNAAQARLMLRNETHRYKAITLDIMLPDEDGISFLKAIRSDAATYDIPVVVVSVKADEAKRELNGGAVNVVDWLQKPIDQARLKRVVKQAAKGSDRLPRVLHVEDEEDVHKVVSVLLQGQCELLWTSSLSASREVLEQEEIDLVLLDIALPDGSGLDLLEVIEQRVKPPRVVIFSAYDVTEKYANKVAAVLIKSQTNNQKLTEVIGNVIAQA